MDVSKVLAELRAERAVLEEVILGLEKLTSSHRGPGRPRGARNKAANLAGPGSEHANSEPDAKVLTGRTA
jgi:hypothetical protein